MFQILCTFVCFFLFCFVCFFSTLLGYCFFYFFLFFFDSQGFLRIDFELIEFGKRIEELFVYLSPDWTMGLLFRKVLGILQRFFGRCCGIVEDGASGGTAYGDHEETAVEIVWVLIGAFDHLKLAYRFEQFRRCSRFLRFSTLFQDSWWVQWGGSLFEWVITDKL